jgi:hypothetical protein
MQGCGSFSRKMPPLDFWYIPVYGRKAIPAELNVWYGNYPARLAARSSPDSCKLSLAAVSNGLSQCVIPLPATQEEGMLNKGSISRSARAL